MGKKELTQSIAVSEEEQFTIRVLAAAHGIKPATAARQLFFRGLFAFLNDRTLRAPKLESEVHSALVKLIGTDKELSRVAGIVQSEIKEKSHTAKKAVGRKNRKAAAHDPEIIDRTDIEQRDRAATHRK